MHFTDLISLVQATLAPAVLISGCGLLCLVVQNRYGRVIDRIRLFNQEHSELKRRKSESKYGEDYGRRVDEIKVEVSMLVKRGNYLKLSLFSLFAGVLSFILTSLVIFLEYVVDVPAMFLLAIVTLSAGLLLLILGIIFTIREVAVSYAAVIHEVESQQYGSKS